MFERLRTYICILFLMMVAVAAAAPRAAFASDLTILAEMMGDEVVDVHTKRKSRSRSVDDEQDETGVWIQFGHEESDRIAQVSEYYIFPEPNEDGTVDVIVRTTLINTNANFAYFTTTKTIFCDGKEAAYIGPDYREADPGESISQQERFTVSGGGRHHITSIETPFREGTETSAGWDFDVNVPFIITAEADKGGSIEPDGASFVYEGDSKTYQIEASSGYRIGTVLVDGVSVGAREQYGFLDIACDHSIEARFVKTWQVTIVDGVTGEVIDRQTVDDGGDADVPREPSHEGYRFDGWSGSFEDIQDDTEITAQFIRTHDVVFLDRTGREISRQTVDHGDAARDPGIPSWTGYETIGWDTPFDNVTKNLTIRPVYEPIITVSVPTLVACTIMSDGSVVAPGGYKIENHSVVAVETSSIDIEYLESDVSISLADEQGVVFATGGKGSGIDIDANRSKCFTWHVDDLDARIHEELITQAARKPVEICRVRFTFEAAV